MNHFFNKLKNKKGSNVSKALIYSYLTILFQVIITPASIIIITRVLTSEEQGYYYTFLSLISLQGVFELGLFTVIVNKTSALYSHLKRFDVTSLYSEKLIRENLASFYRLTQKLYFYIGTIFFFCVSLVGFLFFSNEQTTLINEIQILWIAYCFLNGVQISFLGLNSFLEGCGEIEVVEKWRLIAYISSGCTLIICLTLGLGLSSLILATIPRIIKDILVIKYMYRDQFKLLNRSFMPGQIGYFVEVFPMQSKLAISGIFSYLQQGIFVPIIFSTLGPVQAGLIGVALQITSFVQQILTRIVHINQPRLARLVSIGSVDQVHALVFSMQRFTLIASTLILLGFTICFGIFDLFDVAILERVPELWIFFILIVSACIYGQLAILVGYLRSFVEERVHYMSITSAILNVLLCYLMIDRFKLYAVSISYFVTITFVSIPWAYKIVMRKKKSLNDIKRRTIVDG